MAPGDFDTFDSTVYSPHFMNKTRQVSSRLAKKEQKKLARQTFFFIFLAIGLVVLFLFVILPGFIRLANEMLGTEVTFHQEDTIPPQVPVMMAPPTAVSQSQLELTGFGEAESEMVLVVNGREITRTTADADGSFSFTFELEEGENMIAAYSIDAAGNESALSRSYQVSYYNQPPKLEVISPEPDARFETRSAQTISITGETDPGSRVFLNDRLLMTNSEGVFSGSFVLDEGENELIFRAVDRAGNESEQTFRVEFVY